ncbi:hypothetical protein ONS96_009106 [Cadophora gregata f. sp. sojae]|nr:hypothetical protein ONS96_009106 [Cadophora gregata f. sp. sojae]
MPPSTKTYKITPAPPSSIPTLAHISHAAFKTDTHTQLKELCKPSPKPQSGTSSHAASMASALSSWKSSSKGKIVVLQAVQEESEDANENREDTDENRKAESEVEGEGEHVEEETEVAKPSPQILALETLTDNTMSFWASHFSTPYPSSKPPASSSAPPQPPSHLILIALTIHPLHQGQGLGAILINWGTRIADRHGVFCWVSSSDGGYPVFEKAGFREVGRLAVDLNEFAIGVDGRRVPNPDSGKGKGGWGIYTWRWMKRDAVMR